MDPMDPQLPMAPMVLPYPEDLTVPPLPDQVVHMAHRIPTDHMVPQLPLEGMAWLPLQAHTEPLLPSDRMAPPVPMALMALQPPMDPMAWFLLPAHMVHQPPMEHMALKIPVALMVPHLHMECMVWLPLALLGRPLPHLCESAPTEHLHKPPHRPLQSVLHPLQSPFFSSAPHQPPLPASVWARLSQPPWAPQPLCGCLFQPHMYPILMLPAGWSQLRLSSISQTADSRQLWMH